LGSCLSSIFTPVGMPRPLSVTETELSEWMVTTMSSQWPGECFVNGVVHHFKDEVMQTGAVRGVAYVHAGAFAHRFQAFEDL
jgi:hypothetical protein